jgi:hypothetical protein
MRGIKVLERDLLGTSGIALIVPCIYVGAHVKGLKLISES